VSANTEDLLVAAGFERRMVRSPRVDGRERLTAVRGNWVWYFATEEQARTWVLAESPVARQLERGHRKDRQ
jgi:hypothetical protein